MFVSRLIHAETGRHIHGPPVPPEWVWTCLWGDFRRRRDFFFRTGPGASQRFRDPGHADQGQASTTKQAPPLPRQARGVGDAGRELLITEYTVSTGASINAEFGQGAKLGNIHLSKAAW